MKFVFCYRSNSFSKEMKPKPIEIIQLLMMMKHRHYQVNSHCIDKGFIMKSFFFVFVELGSKISSFFSSNKNEENNSTNTTEETPSLVWTNFCFSSSKIWKFSFRIILNQQIQQKNQFHHRSSMNKVINWDWSPNKRKYIFISQILQMQPPIQQRQHHRHKKS